MISGKILGLALLLGAGEARAESGFYLDYGQSSDVWKVYNNVKSAEKDLFKINRILNDNFGQYQTAFTRIGSDFDIKHINRPFAKVVRADISVESAALGLVQNPVVPELVAAATAVAIGRVSVRAEPLESWAFEAAVLFGWGVERRLSAVSTDLIESIPFQKDEVRLWGADLLARKDWKLGGDRITTRAAWKGTKYNGLEARTSVALDRQLRSFTNWWEGRADWFHGDWNLHALMGSHPLPENVLPRVWDRVANTNAWRELGAMSGAGIQWHKSFVTLTGGLYAGYLGAVLRAAASERTQISFSTYGIENSSAYRTFGQRVYVLSSYLAF